MQINDEAKKRKKVLMDELAIIDKLLSLYDKENTHNDIINGGLTISDAIKFGALEVRGVNCILNDNWFPNRAAKDISLRELRDAFFARPESEILKMPNYGRKSLNRMKQALERIL